MNLDLKKPIVFNTTTTSIVTEDDLVDDVETSPIESFVYEVKLSNGKTVSYLNRDDLDKFIEDNKDINFDLEF